MTNTCLTGVACFTGFDPTGAGAAPSEPDAPKDPGGSSSGAARARTAASRPAAPSTPSTVDTSAGLVEDREVAGALVGAATTTRRDAVGEARGEPSTTASSTSSPSTTSTSGALRGSSASVVSREAASRLCRIVVASRSTTCGSLVAGGDGRAEQLPHPLVRRRLGVGHVVAELLEELLAEGVDQRRLAGPDERVADLPACASTLPPACSTAASRVPSTSSGRAPGVLSTVTARPASRSPATVGATASARSSADSLGRAAPTGAARPASGPGSRGSAVPRPGRCRWRARARGETAATRWRRTSVIADPPRDLVVA